jgi:hypothetical protein
MKKRQKAILNFQNSKFSPNCRNKIKERLRLMLSVNLLSIKTLKV